MGRCRRSSVGAAIRAFLMQMEPRLPKEPAPLVGAGICLTLAIAFALLGLFQFLTAQVVEQPGIFGEFARGVPVVAIAGAVTAVFALPRLSVVYRALWVSAAGLICWFVVTWLATLGS